MKKINKSKVIINAFTGELPKGEEWYENRLSICGSCEFNSANSIAETMKDKFKDLLHVGQPFCRVCDCFLDRKASMKEEECPKGKWDALMIHTADKEDWNLYNNSSEKVKISLSDDGSKYEVLYKEVIKKDDDTSIEILLEGTNPIKEVKVGCGCTVARYEHIGNNLWKINSFFNNSLGLGIFTKNIIVTYSTPNGQKTLIITLKGNKQ